MFQDYGLPYSFKSESQLSLHVLFCRINWLKTNIILKLQSASGLYECDFGRGMSVYLYLCIVMAAAAGGGDNGCRIPDPVRFFVDDALFTS